jgi:TPP-dependent pyruvate/acetoin dehydrogenase alpha subunit
MTDQDFARLYRSLKLIRRVEERVAEIYPSDKIKSPVHLSIGQEAVSVGVCDALNTDDYAIGTYRGHALYLAKGGSLNGFMAELFGKIDGCAQGKGGSMHMIDTGARMLGCSAVVATNIPIALGYAWTLKREGKQRVIVCFFGDGATEEGVFYESLNFASLHKLPVLFVCENNALAIHTPLETRWAHHDIADRVEGFGIPVRCNRDMDVLAIREIATEALAGIRAGNGPVFMECHTYRWRQHVGPNEDFDAGYRSRDEMLKWVESDQVERISAMLGAGEKEAIDADIENRIAQSVAFADESPFPGPQELMTHVYAE